MKITNPFRRDARTKQGSVVGYGILWLLGVPLPILVLIAMLRGCA